MVTQKGVKALFFKTRSRPWWPGSLLTLPRIAGSISLGAVMARRPRAAVAVQSLSPGTGAITSVSTTST